MEQVLSEEQDWAARMASLMLLVFGTGLCLAGVIFFFAFNWASLPDLAKLGIIEVGMVGCVAGACMQGMGDVARRVLLVAAGVLVGVFLAVFGQIYQTGADAWQLFALWSVLLAPFVALARLQGGWVLQTILTCVAVVAFLHQEFALGEELTVHLLPGAVALVASAVWSGLELLRSRRAPAWLHRMWSRSVFAILVFGALLVPLVADLLDDLDVGLVAQTTVFAAASLAILRRFGAGDVDISTVAIGGIAWLIALVTWAGLHVFQGIDSTLLASFIMVVFTLMCTTALVAGLRALSARGSQ